MHDYETLYIKVNNVNAIVSNKNTRQLKFKTKWKHTYHIRHFSTTYVHNIHYICDKNVFNKINWWIGDEKIRIFCTVA